MKKVYFEPATNVLNLGTRVMADANLTLSVSLREASQSCDAPVRPASALYI